METMIWKKGEFKIAIGNSFDKKMKLIRGYVLADKGIGINKCLDNQRYWIITHLNSGYAIIFLPFKTLRKAKKYAEKIAMIKIDGKTIDWNIARTILHRKYGKLNSKIIYDEMCPINKGDKK